MKRLLVVLVLAPVLSPHVASAQLQSQTQCPPDRVACASTNGPSYEATRDWIIGTLSKVAGGEVEEGNRGSDTYSYSDIDVEACHLKFREHDLARWPNGAERTRDSFDWRVDIPLARIRSVDISSLFSTIRLNLSAATEAVNYQGTPPKSSAWGSLATPINANERAANLSIDQPGIDASSYALRLQKALVHAAALCRAQAAQHLSDQPF